MPNLSPKSRDSSHLNITKWIRPWMLHQWTWADTALEKAQHPPTDQKDTRDNTSTILTSTRESRFPQRRTLKHTKSPQGNYSRENSNQRILRHLLVITCMTQETTWRTSKDGKAKREVITRSDQTKRASEGKTFSKMSLLQFAQTLPGNTLKLRPLWGKRRKIFRRRPFRTWKSHLESRLISHKPPWVGY